MFSGYPLVRQLVKFSVVGVSTTVLDFALFVGLAEVLNVNYLLSNVMSFSVSVMVNYLASMCFVFERRKGLGRCTVFVRFVALSIMGLGINSFCVWSVVEHTDLDCRVAKLLAALIVSAWNFVTRKIFLEAHRFAWCASAAERITVFCATNARVAENRALIFLRDVLNAYDEACSLALARRHVRLERRRVP